MRVKVVAPARINRAEGSLRSTGSAAIRALTAYVRRPPQRSVALIGYEFPYWFKSAFGATRCGRRWRAVLARPSGDHGSEHPIREEPGARVICALPFMARGSTHLRAADPLHEYLHAGTRHQGRCASLRDDLRPPLTPGTDEQEGWLSVRWLSLGLARVPPVSPGPCSPRIPGTPRGPR
jgi:hypothetical protein